MKTATTLAQALQFFATNKSGVILCVYRNNKSDEQSQVCDNEQQATEFFNSLPAETPKQEFARKYNDGLL